MQSGCAVLSSPARPLPRTLRFLALLGGLVFQTAAEAQAAPLSTGRAGRLDAPPPPLAEPGRALGNGARPDAAGTARLERELLALRGVLSAVANQALESVRVEYVPGLVTARDMEDAVERAGFAVAQPIPEQDPVERDRQTRRRGQHTLLGPPGEAARGARTPIRV